VTHRRIRESLEARARLLRRRGIRYIAYLVYGVALPKLVARTLFRGGRQAANLGPGASDASPALKRAVELALDDAHRKGLTSMDLRPENLDTETLSFRSLDGAKRHRDTNSFAFRYRRDRDRELVNRRYGTHLMTERNAREALAPLSSRANEAASRGDWYAAIDFGSGLTIGPIWSTDAGTGRWDYFNRPIMEPLLAGRRVLDLGANNGVMPMSMLRAGAREVVAFEYAADHIEAAEVVRRIFEWRDMREYALSLRQGDMRDVLTQDLGEFDLVTALCSLYYLPAADMAAVVRHASTIAPGMILQGNVETPPADAFDAITGELRSGAPFLKSLLEQNGFPTVSVHAPRGFSRPLVVGWRSDARAYD
jgi:2-polyprenyl-3-methyl-5-hydroxy-6-metoxy-1,4-benzoquinol methylase